MTSKFVMPEMNQRKFSEDLTKLKKKSEENDTLIEDLGGVHNVDFSKMLKEQNDIVNSQNSQIEKFSRDIAFQKVKNEQIKNNVDFYYVILIVMFLLQIFIYALEYKQVNWKTKVIEYVLGKEVANS